MLRSREGREDSPEFSRRGDEKATRSGSTEVEPDTAFSLDDVFDILRNSRRRYVLQYLLDAESESAELGEVAEHIAALENDKRVSEITSSERKRVYVGLYQNHLPRMDDAGVVDFDSDRKRIRARNRARELRTYLHADSRSGQTDRNRWPVYDLVVASGGALALAASFLLEGPSVLNPVSVSAGVVGCFLALSLIQLYSSEQG